MDSLDITSEPEISGHGTLCHGPRERCLEVLGYAAGIRQRPMAENNAFIGTVNIHARCNRRRVASRRSRDELKEGAAVRVCARLRDEGLNLILNDGGRRGTTVGASAEERGGRARTSYERARTGIRCGPPGGLRNHVTSTSPSIPFSSSVSRIDGAIVYSMELGMTLATSHAMTP